MRRLTLYTRPGCHLCDEARAIAEALVAEHSSIELEEIDIDSDDDLLRAYLERIPVMALDGRVVSELVPDAESLRVSLLKVSAL